MWIRSKDKHEVFQRISFKHYLVLSFAVAAFALVGEALCSLKTSGSIRSGEGNTTNALLIAPTRTASPRRPFSR